MRKGKLVAVLSAGLLALAALGGTAFAHWGPGSANSTEVYDQVAQNLGSDQQTVADAFATASQEARDAAVANRLANAVTNGVITQDEADQIKAWYDSAPDALNQLQGMGRVDINRVAEILGVDVSTLQQAMQDARQTVALNDYKARLDQAVADGKITQDQADTLWAQAQVGPVYGGGMKGFGPELGHEGFGGRGGHERGFGGPRGFGGFGGF